MHAEPHQRAARTLSRALFIALSLDPKFGSSGQLGRTMLLPRAFPSLPCSNLPLIIPLPNLYL